MRRLVVFALTAALFGTACGSGSSEPEPEAAVETTTTELSTSSTSLNGTQETSPTTARPPAAATATTQRPLVASSPTTAPKATMVPTTQTTTVPATTATTSPTTTTTQRLCPPSGPVGSVSSVTVTTKPSPIGPEYSYLVSGTLRNPSTTNEVYVGMIYVRTSDLKTATVSRKDPWVAPGSTVSWETSVFAAYGTAPSVPTAEAFPTSWFWGDLAVYDGCPNAQEAVPHL